MKNDGESVYFTVGTQVKNDETKIENKQKKYSGQKTKGQTKYQKIHVYKY